jgi:uncharacterized membrane protein
MNDPDIDKNSASLENQISSIESTIILPDQVIENIKKIVNHQDKFEQNKTKHQKILDKIAVFLGQPAFLYFQVLFFSTWCLGSFLSHRGLLAIEFPLFDFREDGLEIVSLLISTGVLIYQARQERLSEDRSHLTLQLNLLTEQKIAKLISLIEELRTDLPNVKNRDDREASMMQQPTDPQAILAILKTNLDTPSIPAIESVPSIDQPDLNSESSDRSPH